MDMKSFFHWTISWQTNPTIKQTAVHVSTCRYPVSRRTLGVSFNDRDSIRALVALTRTKNEWKQTNEAHSKQVWQFRADIKHGMCTHKLWRELLLNICNIMSLWGVIYCSNNSQDPKQTQMFTTWEKRGGLLFQLYHGFLCKTHKRDDLTHILLPGAHLRFRKRHTQVWEEKIPTTTLVL